MTATAKRPNPDRIVEVMARILERRYNVTIKYTIKKENTA